MAEKHPQRVAIYARISDDPEGREAGVERQVEDARKGVEKVGWTLAPIPPFVDNDLSASRYAKRERPAYKKMLKLAREGEIDGIAFYKQGRLTRQPREFEDLLDLHDEHGVRFIGSSGAEMDVATSDRRTLARLLNIFDAQESDVISERVTRAFQQRREDGIMPPSSRAFGYKKGGVEVEPREAALIREAVDRMLQEDWSLGMVVKDWNERKVPTLRGGKLWTRVQVQRALTGYRTAGILTHRGEVIGPAATPGIITPEERDKLLEALASRRQTTARYQKRMHWLTGFMVCGRCMTTMKTNALRTEDGGLRRDSYVVCSRSSGGCGNVKRNLPTLLTFMENVVQGLIEDRELHPDAGASDGGGTALPRAREALLEVQRDIDALKAAFREKKMRLADYQETLSILRDQEDEAKQEVERLEAKADTGLDVDENLADLWESGDIESRRRVMAELIDHIIIHPIGRVGPVRMAQSMSEKTEIVPASA